METEEQVLNIFKYSLEPRAKEIFIETSGGFDKENKSDRQLYSKAINIKEEMILNFKVKAIYKTFGKDVIVKNGFVAEEWFFKCLGFNQFGLDNIDEVIPFVLTIGECKANLKDFVIDNLYLDLWGSAFLEAAIEQLVDFFGKNARVIGPGFCGMPKSMHKKIFKLINPEKIGVKIDENGKFEPVKTVEGIVIKGENGKMKIFDFCNRCEGNLDSCEKCVCLEKHFLSIKE